MTVYKSSRGTSRSSQNSEHREARLGPTLVPFRAVAANCTEIFCDTSGRRRRDLLVIVRRHDEGDEALAGAGLPQQRRLNLEFGSDKSGSACRGPFHRGDTGGVAVIAQGCPSLPEARLKWRCLAFRKDEALFEFGMIRAVESRAEGEPLVAADKGKLR